MISRIPHAVTPSNPLLLDKSATAEIATRDLAKLLALVLRTANVGAADRRRHVDGLEEEFPAHLVVVAALEGLAPLHLLEALHEAADDGAHEGFAHVFGVCAEGDGAQHAELFVGLLGWIGVDGEGAGRCFLVHWD